MHAAHSAQRTARLVLVRSTDVVEVLGPTIEFLTAPETDDASACIMRGTVPSGVFVLLHSHADPETCILVSGELDALTHSDAGFEWVRLKEADVFHVPADARHAFRNVPPASATMILVSTARMGRFFREIGAPIIPERNPDRRLSGSGTSCKSPSGTATGTRHKSKMPRSGFPSPAPDSVAPTRDGVGPSGHISAATLETS